MSIGKLLNFFKIKTIKSKRVSPYLESEIWEKDELFRNKPVFPMGPSRYDSHILSLIGFLL